MSFLLPGLLTGCAGLAAHSFGLDGTGLNRGGWSSKGLLKNWFNLSRCGAMGKRERWGGGRGKGGFANWLIMATSI